MAAGIAYDAGQDMMFRKDTKRAERLISSHNLNPDDMQAELGAIAAQPMMTSPSLSLPVNKQPGSILALQRIAGNAATQRMLKGRIQREAHNVPTSATGLIMNMEHANIVNNWFQVQADSLAQDSVWVRSGLSSQLQTILSGPGYWSGHRTWSPREAVVDLGTLSDNIGISISVELMQDNENYLGSRGRVGLQGQSSGQSSFGDSAESSQSTSMSASGEHGGASAEAGSESSNTYGSEGGLELGGEQQQTTNSRNSMGVTADLFVRVHISVRRFNRFGSTQSGTGTNVISAGTIQYIDPTHQRHVAVPRGMRRLNTRPRGQNHH